MPINRKKVPISNGRWCPKLKFPNWPFWFWTYGCLYCTLWVIMTFKSLFLENSWFPFLFNWNPLHQFWVNENKSATGREGILVFFVLLIWYSFSDFWWDLESERLHTVMVQTMEQMDTNGLKTPSHDLKRVYNFFRVFTVFMQMDDLCALTRKNGQ